MSDPGDGLRAVALTVMLVLAAFVGTVAFSGAAAAVANEAQGVRIESAVEYDGRVETTFNVSTFADPPEAGDVDVWVDGRRVVNDGTQDATLGGKTWSIGEFNRSGRAARFDVLTDGSTADVAPNRNLTVEFEGLSPNGARVSDPERVVTVSGAVVREGGSYDDAQNAKRIYRGAPLALVAQAENSAVFLNATGQELSTGTDSVVLSVDSTSDKFTTGEVVKAEFTGPDSSTTSQYFELRDLGLTATATDTSIDDETNLTVDVSANRGGSPFVARLSDADGNVVATTTRDLDGSGSATVNFGPQLTGGSPYSVSVTDNATNVTATTSDITVSEATSGSVSFNQTVYSDERGDVVAFGLGLSNTDTATVTIGTTGDNNWAQNVTVQDGNGDGFVALEFNTYTAGTSDNTDASGSPYRVYSTTDGTDSVTNVAAASGTFDPSDPAADTLAGADYSLSAVAGPDPASRTQGGADSSATLSLGERSTDALTTYVAPDGKRGDIDSPGAIENLLANGNVTETSEIAEKDILLAKVDASGLEGLLANWTSGSTPAADSPTDALFTEAWSGDPAWEFWVNQTNPGPNANAYNATLNASNTELVADANSDVYWLVVDTDLVTEFSDDDELEGNFTTRDEDDVNGGDTTVLDNWTFADPVAAVDTNADIDDDGRVDEVEVLKASGQRITGSTNAAPGTELSVRATGTDTGSPFVKPLTAYVQPDGNWTATADFSENTQGANFTVNVKRGIEQIVPEKVDGRIAAAPSASVTFNDQESVGSQVSIASVTLSDGGFVAVHLNNASGEIVGSSSYLEPGSSSDVNIDLNRTLTEDTTLVAMPHQDTDGDQAFEFEFGSSVDAPYTENGSAVTDSASVTVVEGNAAPTASDDSYTVVADENLSVSAPGVLENDTDPDGDSLSVTTTPVSGPTNGSLTLSTDGSFSYTPDSGFTGTDSFTYEVTDGAGGTDTATVSINVTESNTAPTASDDSYAVDAGGTLSVSQPGVLGNDTDPDGDSLTVTTTPVSGPADGTLTLNADGSFAYTPDSGFTGTDSFTYEVSDGNGGTDTAIVFIDVTVSNDAPTATNDSYAVDTGGTLSVSRPGVLSNDSDPDGDSLTASVVDRPSNGVVTVDTDGSVVYTPASGFTGTDTFTYRASDGSSSDTATVTIEVRSADEPGDGSVTLSCVGSGGGAPYVADSGLTVYENDSAVTSGTFGADGESVTFQGGAITFESPGNAQVRLEDGTGSRVCLGEVRANGSAPLTVAPDGDVSPLEFTDGAVQFASRDPVYDSGDTGVDLGYEAVSPLSLTVRATGLSQGTTVVASDAETGGTLATGTVDADGALALELPAGTERVDLRTVAAVTANDDDYSVASGESLSVAASEGILANDTGGDGPLSVETTPVSGPADGSLTLNADGSFTYTPDSGFTGTDSFTYRVTDGTQTDTATVTIDVSATNDPPVAAGDSYSVGENGTLSVSAPGVLGNDDDPNGDSLTASVVDRPSNGVVTLTEDGSFLYAPASGYTGTDSFTYRVNDGTDTDTATVTIDVSATATNDPPDAADDRYATTEDTQLSVSAPGVLDNDVDPDGDALSVSPVTRPSDGALTVNADGSFTYDPDTGFSGTDTFTYRAGDGTGTADTATVTIRVDPVETNDPPVAGPDSYDLGDDETLLVSAPGVLANDVDPDGNSLSAALLAAPAEGTLTLLADGGFEYSPGPGFDGRDSFRYRVTDGTGATATGVVTIRDEPASGVEIRSLTLGNTTATAADDLTVTRGGRVTVTATVGHTGSEPASRTVTLLVDGTVLDEKSVGLLPGDSETVSFGDLDTTALAAGSHSVTVDVAGARRTASLTVVAAASGRHESGVPTTVFEAVADADGVLGREDVLGMVADYVTGRQTNGVPLTRGQVLALLSYYITER